MQEASGTVTYDAAAPRLRPVAADAAARPQRAALPGAVDAAPRSARSIAAKAHHHLGKLAWRLAAPTPPDRHRGTTSSCRRHPSDFVAGERPAHRHRRHVATPTAAARCTSPPSTCSSTRCRPLRSADALRRRRRSRRDAARHARAPEATGTLTITNGRVERVSYQTAAGAFHLRRRDVRRRRAGSIKRPACGSRRSASCRSALFDPTAPEQPIDVTIKSSTISLGLIEGLTDVVRNVSGDITLDVKAVGTSRDPHVDGRVAIANAGFLVAATGSPYKNIRAAITLAHRAHHRRRRCTSRTPTATRSTCTAASARTSCGSAICRSKATRASVRSDAQRARHASTSTPTLQLRGRYEAPRIGGDITINSGTLRVDEILSRALFQPYSTEQTAMTRRSTRSRRSTRGSASASTCRCTCRRRCG